MSRKKLVLTVVAVLVVAAGIGVYVHKQYDFAHGALRDAWGWVENAERSLRNNPDIGRAGPSGQEALEGAERDCQMARSNAQRVALEYSTWLRRDEIHALYKAIDDCKAKIDALAKASIAEESTDVLGGRPFMPARDTGLRR